MARHEYSTKPAGATNVSNSQKLTSVISEQNNTGSEGMIGAKHEVSKTAQGPEY